MQKLVVGFLAVLLAAGAGYYFYSSRQTDLVSQFGVSNDRIAKDLEGRMAPLPYGQVWPFDPTQGLTVTVIGKKQVDDYVVVVAEVKAVADVTPQKLTLDAPPSSDIKSVKVALSGLIKLTYERINAEWYIVGVDSVSLKASPVVN